MSSSPFFEQGHLQLDRTPVADKRQLLAAWSAAVDSRYRGKTVITYKQAAARFIAFLDEQHVEFVNLNPQLLCDYLAAQLRKCRHLGFLQGQHFCREKIFAPAADIPMSCGFYCVSYEAVKVESYLTTEKALARLFEFAADETTIGSSNFFPEVRNRIHASFKKRRLREREDARYPRRALSNEEIAALFRVTGHPRDRMVLALMFKTGVRHQETLLLPDGPEIRERWRNERIIEVESSPGVKRLGNPYLVIDNQLLRLLETYYQHKDAVLKNAPPDDPRRHRLLLGKDGSRIMSIDSMARLWREAGQRAGVQVSPVRNAPLTAHSARYTFVRLLEEAGFSPFWIARLRGDVQTPDPGLRAAWTYAKRSPAELREAYLERFPRLPL